MFQNYVAASLPSLIYPRQCKRRQVSSYDRTGGNDDPSISNPEIQRRLRTFREAG